MNQTKSNHESRVSFNVSEELSKGVVVNINLQQEVIVITTDRLNLVLNETKEIIEQQKEWQTPCGILIACILALCSADFKDFVLSKYCWQAIFVLISLWSFLWLIKSLIKFFKNRGKDDIDVIIEQIKKLSVQVSKTE